MRTKNFNGAPIEIFDNQKSAKHFVFIRRSHSSVNWRRKIER